MNKSAKDIAFDKERAKFRSEIRNLQQLISEKEKENRLLLEEVHQKESEIASKDDWIQRLLEYTELTESDMRKITQKEKIELDILKSIGEFGTMFSRVFGREL